MSQPDPYRVVTLMPADRLNVRWKPATLEDEALLREIRCSAPEFDMRSPDWISLVKVLARRGVMIVIDFRRGETPAEPPLPPGYVGVDLEDLMSRWRTKAHKVICEALRDGHAQGLEGKDLARFVADRYPFGERANHPYKIWLNEFALLVRGEDRPMTAVARPADDRPTPLFGDDQR